MQPTSTQVERSLSALRDSASPSEILTAPRHPEVPPALVAQIEAMPAVRTDRLDEARHRLEDGEYPEPDVLADKMVGRIVCDRLR